MYYAHYDREGDDGWYQALNEHLENVSKACGDRVPPCVSFDAVENGQVLNLARTLGIFHDFGKYLSPFQRYLVEGKTSKYKDHAHISAVLAYSALCRDYISDKKHADNMCVNFLSYLACRLHHGNLTLDVAMMDEKGDYLKKQAKILRDDKEDIVSDFSKVWKGGDLFSMMDIENLEHNKVFNGMAHHMRTRFESERWYFLLCYIFSVLIDSDKMDSADMEMNSKESMDPARVENHIRSKSDTADINDRRNEARLAIRKSVEELEDEDLMSDSIYTITAPTGIGKTLSSVDAAISMASRLESIYGYKPSIISAIPFINIIEQTRKDYEAVFGDGVMVNHGLEEIIKGRSGGRDSSSKLEEKSVEETLLRVESWDSQVVLTTFVQFFHSVFTSRNRALKKLNKIAGSIVILDEVQAIPEDLMPLAGASIHFMSKFFGTRFILMTATKPKIVEFANKLVGKDKMKAIELLKGHEKYFESLDRTRLVIHLDERMSLEGLAGMIQSTCGDEKSALVVLNTIKSSVELYRMLCEGAYFDGEKILYLSTNIIPKKRMEVIEKASEYLKKEKNFIMVSTQTIEAGVDLDFDIAFRDISPISSIIQVAGRVNRKGARERKDVHVFRLENEAKRVYKLHHVENTVRLLESREYVDECDYGSLVDEYYEGLLANPVSDVSRRIWEEGVMKLDFEVVEEFQMIDSDGQVMDVFVEYDEEASKLADTYEDVALRMKEIGRKKDKRYYHLANIMKDIRRKMSRYMISVRTMRIKKNLPERFSARNGVEAGFLWIPHEELERLYDDDTGYIFENGDVLMF